MKIYSQQSNQLSYKGISNDLKFIICIRDRNVEKFESLQKQKIEMLLKYREVQKIIESYNEVLLNTSTSQIPISVIAKAKKSLEDMKIFKDTLFEKLREINLLILAEEEKNY